MICVGIVVAARAFPLDSTPRYAPAPVTAAANEQLLLRGGSMVTSRRVDDVPSLPQVGRVIETQAGEVIAKSESLTITSSNDAAALAAALAEVAEVRAEVASWRSAAALVAASTLSVTTPGRPEQRIIFRTKTPVPFVMTCNSADYVCNDIHGAGVRKEWHDGLGVLIEALVPGDMMVDFGANTGFFGLAAAARGVKTLAVEPGQADVCRINAALNGFNQDIFEFYGVALVEKRDSGPLVQRIPWQNMGSATFVTGSKTTSWTDLFNDATPHIDLVMPTTTIDDVVRKSILDPKRPVKLLKIDVEGFEVYAWRGGQELLASGLVYVVVAEWHPRFLVSAGVEPTEYLRIFAKHGYAIYDSIQGSNKIKPEDIDSWAKATGSNNGDIRFVLEDKPWPPVTDWSPKAGFA